MHVSDPVRSRLTDNLPYLDCWLADMADAIHLLDSLSDYLHHPENPASGDRLLALLRSALVDLSGGVDELNCILNLSERSKLSPKETVEETVPEFQKLICGCGGIDS